MKNLIFLLCVVFAFYSCQEQKKIRELPCEKAYILEWNWQIPDDEKKYNLMLHVVGFSELNKDFNLHLMHQSYYAFDTLIIDSLKDKISDIINEYPTDTAFCYKGGSRIYDGNYYSFIFQKNDSNFIRIYFEPKFLPQDLLFLYNYLYESRKNQVLKDQNIELFSKFEKMIMNGKGIQPTVTFTPPLVIKKKK